MQPSLKNLLSISSLDLTQSHFSGPKGNLGRTPLLPQKFFNFSLLMVNLPLQEVFFSCPKSCEFDVNLIFFEQFLDAPLTHPKTLSKKIYTKSSQRKRKQILKSRWTGGTSEFIRVLGRICWRRWCFFFLQIFPYKRTEVHQSPLPSLPLENRPSPESSSRFWYGGTGVVLIARKRFGVEGR